MLVRARFIPRSLSANVRSRCGSSVFTRIRHVVTGVRHVALGTARRKNTGCKRPWSMERILVSRLLFIDSTHAREQRTNLRSRSLRPPYRGRSVSHPYRASHSSATTITSAIAHDDREPPLQGESHTWPCTP